MLLALVGCGNRSMAPVVDATDPGQRQRQAPRYHTVQKGETLYAISWRYGFDHRRVARWNGIARPYTIYPGQRIRLFPRSRARPATGNTSTGARRERSSKTRITGAASGASKNAKSVDRDRAERRADPVVSKWVWPARGELTATFDADGSGRKGLDIAGRPGQAVIAAAPGEVVYSGSGLIRYGKLIIIKHNSTYFSAYAHNRRLLVKEGDRVSAGQGIAEMGSTGIDRTMLHFEIRRNGKPVDPLRYLPKR